MISDREINIATKRALRGDLEAARKVLSFLWRYRGVPPAKYVAYALVYQIAMNSIVDVSEECRRCGGKCCREGAPLPLYDFDIEEMEKHLGREPLSRYLIRSDDHYLLPRPCPFQQGWACTIHRVKPYACLSYPFATEDEQLPRIKEYRGEGIPIPYTPPHCIAAQKVLNLVTRTIEELRRNLGRDPTPIELLEYLASHRRSTST